ncbi:cell division control protein 2 homolog [Rosa chinensis]|uniref:cell division control protein 2 homolog n=1 Tax=Rosa chinensis TaxID=74649 RepID=UPI000D086A5F|nr:cell division control protein 2 homolog [Rosa chinensis]
MKRYTFAEELRAGKCRRLVAALDKTTDRAVFIAAYNNDVILEGYKEIEILMASPGRHLPAARVKSYDAQKRENARVSLIETGNAYPDLETFWIPPYPIRKRQNVKSLFYQLSTGLRAAHSKGIFLRDLCPEKIRVSENPFRVKLSDFIGAKMLHPMARNLDLVTPPGALERNLSYQAPEQLIGSEMYTSAVDIVEMTTGVVLFSADSTSHPHTHLQSIFGLLGTPTVNPYPPDVHDQWAAQKTCEPTLDLYDLLLPVLGQRGSRLLMRLLCIDPAKRITAEGALKHKYFNGFLWIFNLIEVEYDYCHF